MENLQGPSLGSLLSFCVPGTMQGYHMSQLAQDSSHICSLSTVQLLSQKCSSLVERLYCHPISDTFIKLYHCICVTVYHTNTHTHATHLYIGLCHSHGTEFFLYSSFTAQHTAQSWHLYIEDVWELFPEHLNKQQGKCPLKFSHILTPRLTSVVHIPCLCSDPNLCVTFSVLIFKVGLQLMKKILFIFFLFRRKSTSFLQVCV